SARTSGRKPAGPRFRECIRARSRPRRTAASRRYHPHREWFRGWTWASCDGLLLEIDKLGDAFAGERYKLEETFLAEGFALGGALHFDDAALPRHHEIGVGLGG